MGVSGGKSMPEKQRRRLKTRPRTNLNGADLVRSTFFGPYLYLHPCLCGHLVLAFILAFFSCLGSIFAFLWCNREKRSILSQDEASPMELLDGPLPVPIVA